MDLIFYFAFGAMLFCMTFFAISLVSSTGSSSTRRVREVTTTVQQIKQRTTAGQRMTQSLLRIARGVRIRIGLAESENLRQRFISAGLRGTGPIETYFALRMLGPVAAIAAGSFIPGNTFLWVVGLAAAAYLAPDFWLDRAIKRRRERIRRSIPDAIDLLVICVDAGLGLDQAMLRVGV
ncbi:MAG TPA: hypothetical protein VN670_07170, partial [Acidobacteriaceae bacterium]|nr:hypothetical protein [Acidobacteriaceae bacterium]